MFELVPNKTKIVLLSLQQSKKKKKKIEGGEKKGEKGIKLKKLQLA